MALTPGGAPRRRTPPPHGNSGSLFSARRRGHLAILAVLLLISSMIFVVTRQRSVRVIADGRDITIETHMSKDGAVLRDAGVDLEDGDRVTSLRGAGGEDVLRVERARDVALSVDGATYRLRTHATTIQQLLDEASVVVAHRDSVYLDGALVPPGAAIERRRPLAGGADIDPARSSAGDPIEIDVRRAVSFTVLRDGVESASTSSMATVEQALREAGIRVGPGDRVVPGLGAPLTPGATIEVQTAHAMTVTLPGEHRVLYTFAATVGDALTEAGIVVPEGAFTEPSTDSAVSPGLTVRVVQLSASSDVEREYIEHGTVYRTDDDLGPGETRTEAGHDGVLVRRYEVSYVDGEEAGRALAEEYYETEPMDTVVYYPPQRDPAASAPAEGEIGQSMRVYATWYNAASAGRDPDDPAYGQTATGVQVTYGVVAVDPDIIPLGTRMYIPGYGYAVAADTGGAIKGYIIDLGYPDGVDVGWQSRWLEIYILS